MSNSRDRNPTTTATPARVRMFQATLRPVFLDRISIETEYGRLTIRGRLGQRHADLYEGMLRYAEAYVDPVLQAALPNEILVEPAQLRRVLGSHYCYEQMWRLAKELKSAEVHVVTEKFEAEGNILGEIRRGRSEANFSGALAGSDRTHWRVTLGAALREFLEHDLRRYYDPALVARLTTGVGQAVARWMLTHHRGKQPAGGWKLDTVIQAVCGELTGPTLRKRRLELNSDKKGLSSLGISLDGGRLFLRVEQEEG